MMRASGTLLCVLCLHVIVLAKPTSRQHIEDDTAFDYVIQPEYEDVLKEPPKYLQSCHRNDDKFNLCVKNSLQKFFLSIVNGSSELNLPTIDPLIVPKMHITEGSGDVSLDLQFRDVSIVGLGKAKVVSVGSNLEDNKLELTLKYPSLDLFGEFSSEGGVKSFPVVGNGHFSFNMTDVSAAWIIYLAESESFQSHKYLTIDQFFIDLIPVQISAQFGHAIDGDNKIGEVLNTFFNENAQEIFKMTKPKIMEALSGIFGGLANQVLSRYPTDVLLPP